MTDDLRRLRRTPSQRALSLLERALASNPSQPNFLIQASGGKDGNACMELVRELQRLHPEVRVALCHWYLPCPGLDCVERPMHVLRQRFIRSAGETADKACPVFYVPHYSLPVHLAQGKLRPVTSEVVKRVRVVMAAECEDRGRLYMAAWLSGIPVEQVKSEARKALESRIEAQEDPDVEVKRMEIPGLRVHPWRDIWSVSGHRKDDSLERRAMLSSFRKQTDASGVATGGAVGLNPKERRVYPLHDWCKDDVLSYCRARKCPPPSNFGESNTTNLDPSAPKYMRYLRDHYPRDYAKVLEIFPGARTDD